MNNAVARPFWLLYDLGMAYRVQFTAPNGKIATEAFGTATDALARVSELQSAVTPPTLLYILDDEERELTQEELEELAKKE